MYKLSTDYEQLFRMICEGHIAVGFVDYKFDRGNQAEPPMRDVVQIKRQGEGDIFIGARGISYGSIYPFECQDQAEQNLFVRTCRAINLAFVPSAPSEER